MRKFPKTVIRIIETSNLNLNQISKISGISNTYLVKLVNGKINHPGKDKITSILLALNYTITDINRILAEYDYQPLNEFDIPEILNNNRRRKFEGRILPHYYQIYFELGMAALEGIGGTKIIVKNRPSGIFIPMDLYMMKEFPLEDETGDEAVRFYWTFMKEVVSERKTLFYENCRKGYRFETFICKNCMKESLARNIGPDAQVDNPRKVNLHAKYYANAVAMTLKSPKQHIHKIVRRCSFFHFLIQDADSQTARVSYTAVRPHFYEGERDQLALEGFLSDAPDILEVFKKEVDRCRHAVDQTDDRHTPEGFHAYIRNLFAGYGLGEVFDTALKELLDFPDMMLH